MPIKTHCAAGRHDFIDGLDAAPDCDGHGTIVSRCRLGIHLLFTYHCQYIHLPQGHARGAHYIPALDCSIAIGRNVGIAKEASVMALRVLDCQGAGSVSNVVAGAAAKACRTAAACCVVSTRHWLLACMQAKEHTCLPTAASTIHVAAANAALDWVVRNATKPAVATLSLGIPVGAWSRALEAAARRVLAAGILVVVAAGVPPILAHSPLMGTYPLPLKPWVSLCNNSSDYVAINSLLS
jgi:subtilisin family serine protease